MEIDENFFKTPENKKNTVESFLNEDEKILWRGRAKKSAYILGNSLQMAPIALIWLLFDGFAIYSLIFWAKFPPLTLLFVIPFFAIHLTPVWIWIRSIIKAATEQRTIEYVITNTRVIEFRGKPKHIYASIAFDKMADVSLKINFIDKMLGVGDITIYSDEKLNFNAPDEFVYFHKKLKNFTSLDNCLIISDINDSINLHAKLLKICQSKNGESVTFDAPKIKCKNCGTVYENTKSRCPSCGSPREEK